MLQVLNLDKSYGVARVLANASFVLNDDEHVGLIGPNGTGKSTLLRCIVGEELPDSGTITLSPGTTIGYVPQSFAAQSDRTVGEILAATQQDLTDASHALQTAADALTTNSDSSDAFEDYAAALAQFDAVGGYEREQRAAVVVQKLGLAEIDPVLPMTNLSGGQKTRLALASLLLRSPSLLLLDEPTNHLDVDGLVWLEEFIRGYPGSALIVTHDREFLDHTVTRILYLDSETHALRSYPGNYSAFVLARSHEADRHAEEWKRQEEYVNRVQHDISRLKGEALAIERGTTSRQPGVRRLARKKAGLALSRERKLERFLESEERVDKPRLGWNLKLDFGPPPPGGRDVLRIEHLTFAYEGHDPIIENANLFVRSGERIAVIGPNGAGKSTLFRLIQGINQPTAGRVVLGANVRLGVLSQEQEGLDPEKTVLQTALAERAMSESEARGFLHFFLFSGDDVWRRVDECSLGQRTRLQLACLVLRGCNLLLLDEPLNHLDVEGREHFAAALDAFDGTVLVVAHDRAFLRGFAERVVEVNHGQVRVTEGGFDAD